MAPLATAHPKHNAGKDEGETKQERDGVAEAGKDGWRVRRWRKDDVDGPGFSPRNLLHDIAARVDHRADASRCRAEDGKPSFSGAEPRLGEVLRRPPAPEPRIVRGIEDESGPVLPIDDVTGENDLVT